MLKRKMYDFLKEWKACHKNECLFIKGARQIGKTYLVESFGKAEYKSFVEINFLKSPGLKLIFEGDISADEIFVSDGAKSDSADIQVIRNQCNQCVIDASWNMIYAADDAEFDAMWDEMTADLDGLGFQDLMAWDKDVYTVELEAKNAVK